MISKLIKYWETNKKKILTTVGVLALIILGIQFINAMLVNSYKKEKSQNTVVTKKDEKMEPSKSITDDARIPEKTAEENGQAIKNFIEYCNQSKYQEAFDILSSACKKEIFNNDINLFIQNYIEKIFTANKSYELKLWSANKGKYIYQVKYYENNLLATGGTGLNQNIEDYITIVEENKEKRINVNSFISYEDINKTITQNNITITISNVKVYKTYETYNVTIKNATDKTILIGEEKNKEDICLVDKNSTKYTALLHEIPQLLLNIKPGYQTSIDIKFNKAYNKYREIESMRFQGIILDYENYDKNEEAQKEVIDIKL